METDTMIRIKQLIVGHLSTWTETRLVKIGNSGQPLRQSKGGLPLALILLTLPAMIGQARAVEPIRILTMGQVDPSYSPLLGLMNSEPSFAGTLLICRSIFVEYAEAELRRFMRIYFPRTYEDLIRYDFFVYDQPMLIFFDGTQIEWMYRGLEREGIGSLAFTTSQRTEMFVPWMDSVLPMAFPHDQERIIAKGKYDIVSYDIEVNDDPSLPPVLMPFKDLGIEGIRPFGRLRLLFKKQGTTEWATARNLPFYGFPSCPLLISWEYGEKKSRIWSTANQFHHPSWDQSDGQERYALDIFSNIVLYGCRRNLPDDVLMVHRIRGHFYEYKARMGMLYSLLDFVEGFGANTRKLQGDVSELNSMEKEAEGFYLDQEFESTLAKQIEIFEFFTRVEADAVKVKEHALLWVYALEWLTVSGALAMVAFLTWSLMVRRRYYREVRTTRYTE